MKILKNLTAVLILGLLLGGVIGCNANLSQLFQKTPSQQEQLIRVNIQFTNQREVNCYVKTLGLEKDAQVYTGGPSSNYMYDRNGQITGSFNYQQVLFMSILPDEDSAQ